MKNQVLIDAIKSALAAPGAGESLSISLTNEAGTTSVCISNHSAEPQNSLSTETPNIGEYWEGQGGFYAGIMRDSERQWHLILSQAVIDAPWGKYPSEISGEFSRRDGLHNTKLILAADPENVIAKMTLEINIDGHSDFYWPAQCENNLLFNNIPERMAQERHWSSTQDSARYAWIQYFDDGIQHLDSKDNSLAARAVRRLPI